VKWFSRHAELETPLRGDESRRDEAGAIAKPLGEDSAYVGLFPEDRPSRATRGDSLDLYVSRRTITLAIK
jgi:hypothetical protein